MLTSYIILAVGEKFSNDVYTKAELNFSEMVVWMFDIFVGY